MSVFLIARASSTVLPLSHSVARLELAIADPQPNVLNFASSMTPVVGIHLDLQLHDVAALRRADQTRADVRIVLRQRADVARVLVVIDHFARISHVNPLRFASPMLYANSLRSNYSTLNNNLSVHLPLHRRQVDAFLCELVQRRHLAQSGHDLRELVGNVVDFFLRSSSGRDRTGSTNAQGRRPRQAPSARTTVRGWPTCRPSPTRPRRR